MTSHYLKLIVSSALVCGAASSASAQFSFSDDFNGLTAGNNLQATTPQNNWFASANSFVVEAGTGLSGSNSIATASTTDRTAIWDVGSFDFANGAITASIYFNVTTSGGSIQLSLFPGNNSNANRVSLQLDTNTGSNAIWRSVNNGASTTGTGAAPSLGTALTAGSWYYMTATFTPNGANLDLTGTLFNSSNTGVVGTQVGTSYSFTLAAPAVLSDSTIYGGFRASFVGKSDNIAFTQIPEPSAFAALAGLGALGFAASRRRRRAA
jgi:hypothetical protein